MLPKLSFLFLFPLLFAACSPELVPLPQSSPAATSPAASPTAIADPLTPLPGEEKLSRGEVFINLAEIVTLESNPPQFRIHIAGNLPTPCHHLRAQVASEDAQNQILVQVYSLYDPNQSCTTLLQPFDTSIPLGNLPAGHYSVLVNGKKIGELITP
jgi:hypothetical protein